MKINNQEIIIETISFIEMKDVVENTEKIENLESVLEKLHEYKVNAVKSSDYEQAALYRDFQNLIITKLNIIKHQNK